MLLVPSVSVIVAADTCIIVTGIAICMCRPAQERAVLHTATREGRRRHSLQRPRLVSPPAVSMMSMMSMMLMLRSVAAVLGAGDVRHVDGPQLQAQRPRDAGHRFRAAAACGRRESCGQRRLRPIEWVLVLVGAHRMEASCSAQPLQRVLVLVLHVRVLVVAVSVAIVAEVRVLVLLKLVQPRLAIAAVCLAFALAKSSRSPMRRRQAADVTAQAAGPEVAGCACCAHPLPLPLSRRIVIVAAVRWRNSNITNIAARAAGFPICTAANRTHATAEPRMQRSGSGRIALAHAAEAARQVDLALLHAAAAEATRGRAKDASIHICIRIRMCSCITTSIRVRIIVCGSSASATVLLHAFLLSFLLLQHMLLVLVQLSLPKVWVRREK